jgi:flavin reductase (DIM6/NTAB) family NADH-FMN oxidoreductase RutF
MKKSLGANTLIYPTPAWIVGTYDKSGRPNAMTIAWGGICCSQPPCLAISLRKATYSYGNIVERKAFTVSVPSAAQMKEADYFGIVSGKKIDKLAVAGMTATKAEFVDAPYVEECSLVLECRLLHTIEIGLHTQFIGEIMDVKADEAVLAADGLPDMDKVQPFVFAPGPRTYYRIGDFVGKGFAAGKELMKDQG